MCHVQLPDCFCVLFIIFRQRAGTLGLSEGVSRLAIIDVWVPFAWWNDVITQHLVVQIESGSPVLNFLRTRNCWSFVDF